MTSSRTSGIACCLLLLVVANAAFASPDSNHLPTAGAATPPEDESTRQATGSEQWAMHGQFTNLTQHHLRFRSPYSGNNSLDARGRTEETTDLTLYAGVALWPGAEFWANSELDQGFGLSNTVGVAGFPSGEAYKIGASTPYPRLPRAFIRQVIPLGGDQEAIAPAPNQLGGSKSSDNLTLTIGKFSVVDVFDTNAYAHDPRVDFMNWSIIDSGAFDYAADAWGFTYGGAAELTRRQYTIRAGVFQLSPIPNGKIVQLRFGQYSVVGEIEERHEWHGRPGKIKVLGFVNRARMGAYRDAVQQGIASSAMPDIASVRRFRSRAGLALNIEQELAHGVGGFLRASMNDGSKEAYEFTEINRSVAAGITMTGERWGRQDDTVGLAGVANKLSGDAQAYFAAGGMGILIGDGALSYRAEKVIEAYYSARLNPHLTVSLDYQHIANPAYNHDRGPVSVYAIRVHADF
jgi:high affinity Mn2+ porin